MHWKPKESMKNIQAHAQIMAKKAGIKGDLCLVPLECGGNNRVFELQVNGTSFFLKKYFRHENDPRDRLGTEFSFLSFAWERGLRRVPQPIVYDAEHGLGMYLFVPGRRLKPGEITEGLVCQALDFYAMLNREKDAPTAHELPIASEACFSLGEHVACVERRLARLRKIAEPDEIHGLAAEFVRNDLCEAWNGVRETVETEADSAGLDLDAVLPREEWRLSPSDFGFHNALLGDDGLLYFLDFEYAGWDDPAKTVCDFFCQPAVPVLDRYFSMFEASAVSGSSASETLRSRIRLLFPLYKLKWCCIILNVFLPEGGDRRAYATDKAGLLEHKISQLQKARSYLSSTSILQE